MPCGQQLGGDQAGLDGLADADVVGDEQPDGVLAQGQQQRHELVGTGRDGDPGQAAERPAGGAEPDPQGVAQQAGGAVVAEVVRGGRREGGAGDLLDAGQDAGDVVDPTAEGSHDQQVGVDSGRTTQSRPRAWTREPIGDAVGA